MSSIPQTTKAFAFPQNITRETGPKGLHAIEIPTPKPGPDDVLVKVHAVSLNYRDIMVARKLYPGTMAKATEKDGPIPTSDAAGEVVEVGSNVKDLKVGDRVQTLFSPPWQDGGFRSQWALSAWGAQVNGCLAQYISNRATAFVPIPAGLSYEEASTLPCAALTAYHAIFNLTSGLQPSTTKQAFAGQSVLVQGSGGVSIFGAQLAQAMGAGRIFVTSSSDAKLKEYQKIIPGLRDEDTINYKSTPNWGEEVQKRTNGKGVDHILEIGGANTINNSIVAAGEASWIHVIGARGGGASAEEGKQLSNSLTSSCIFKGIHVRGVFVGSRKLHEELNEIVSSAGIKPVVDKVFSFEDSVAAFEHIESGDQFGKIVIKVT